MARIITDYRTDAQKRAEAKREKIYSRYQELLGEGLTQTASCRVTAQEHDWTPQGVRSLVKRLEAQQAS